jgi:multicomponent K+:H+ antiporter subunit G
MLEIIVAVLLLIGSFFTLVGSIGLARLPDFFMRLHGPSKATTLGVGGMLLAAIVSSIDTGFTLHEVLITLFLFITAPVSAYLMGQAALKHRTKSKAAITEDFPGIPR